MKRSLVTLENAGFIKQRGEIEVDWGTEKGNVTLRPLEKLRCKREKNYSLINVCIVYYYHYCLC